MHIKPLACGRMDRRTYRLATPLVAGVVVLVAGAAVGASLSGEEGGTSRPASATTTAAATTLVDTGIGSALRLPPPAPGAFQGTLVWNAIDCATGTLDLATGAAAPGLPERACTLWSATDGGALAFTDDARPGATALRVLVRATGRTHDGPGRGGTTAIAGDGTVATCGAGQVVEQRPDGVARTLPGCGPAYAGGRLVRISADERRVVDDRDRTVVPATSRSIRLLAAAGDHVAAQRTGDSAGGTIEIWRDGRPDGQLALDRTGRLADLRVARGGGTVLVRLGGPQDWALYRTRREGQIAAIGEEGLREGAFSPDGRYVAVVVASAIVIVDADRLAPLAAIPADAKEIAWLA